jgi:hypothetical protein
VSTLAVRQLGRVLTGAVPLCHMVVTFACYTLVAKKPLSAAIVFSALSGASYFTQRAGPAHRIHTGFRLLRESLIELIDSIPRLIQGETLRTGSHTQVYLAFAANVSMGRLQEFLNDVCLSRLLLVAADMSTG